ncbi:MAG: hypothetical protein HC809_12510 [Gammaproteobacteria bacterium]|nr:hypothetical protein [Gammaproteobacteria bacterium]
MRAHEVWQIRSCQSLKAVVCAALVATLMVMPAAADQPPWWNDSPRQSPSGERPEVPPAASTDAAPPESSSFSGAGGGPFLEEFLILPKAQVETLEERARQPTVTEAAGPPVSIDALAERYAVQAGDLLQISVWREPELTRELRVSPDGWITFPLVGELSVAGQTLEEIRSELETRLGRFVNQAVVDVSVKEPDGNRIFVLGKVNRPGAFPFSKSIDVMQALSLAGGTSKFAAIDDIRILRRSGAQQQTFDFSYSDVERGRRLDQNIVLESGDVVVVP